MVKKTIMLKKKKKFFKLYIYEREREDFVREKVNCSLIHLIEI